MRCSRCGYTSFDYLSECRSCNTGLAKVRDELGFPPVKPAMPFLLGSLLKDSQPAALQRREIIPDDSAASSLPEIVFEDGFDKAPNVEAPGRAVAGVSGPSSESPAGRQAHGGVPGEFYDGELPEILAEEFLLGLSQQDLENVLERLQEIPHDTEPAGTGKRNR